MSTVPQWDVRTIHLDALGVHAEATEIEKLRNPPTDLDIAFCTGEGTSSTR
jgi:hypothetical protein